MEDSEEAAAILYLLSSIFYFFTAAPTASWRFASGPRNIVWQCWHFTSLPRTSSGTERILRQRRFGQMSWQGIAGVSDDLSVRQSEGLSRPINPSRWCPEHCAFVPYCEA